MNWHWHYQFYIAFTLRVFTTYKTSLQNKRSQIKKWRGNKILGSEYECQYLFLPQKEK